MTIATEIKRLIGSWKRFDTLGGKSFFEARVSGNQLLIRTASGREYRVSEDLIEMTAKRFESLPSDRKFCTGEYTDTKWKACPHRILCPYIARLLKEI